ncbi:MAG: glycine cleavage system protein GcvH [Thermoplasmata archaeon]|nr:glycine cleavage system protein GcvH [Thermoplasmata archaeon]
MVSIEEIELREGLYYTKSHEWCRLEDDVATVGITDYAAKVMTDIVYVEAPEVEDVVTQGEPCGTIESVKAAEDIYSPLSGRVVEVNSEVLDSPEVLNSAPYDNWIFRIKISNRKELTSLMSREEYCEYLKKEMEKGEGS